MPQKKVRGAALRKLRKSLSLRPQEMAASLSITHDSYVNLECGRRHLYASDLLRIYISHGITPNDILLPAEESARFVRLAALRPPTAIARSLILRYLRLPIELRHVLDRLADALYRASKAKGEIDE